MSVHRGDGTISYDEAYLEPTKLRDVMSEHQVDRAISYDEACVWRECGRMVFG